MSKPFLGLNSVTNSNLKTENIGDFTSPNQSLSKSLLRQNYEKAKLDLENQLSCNKSNFKHSSELCNTVDDPTLSASLVPGSAISNRLISANRDELNEHTAFGAADSIQSLSMWKNMPKHSITEKPNEKCPSPIIPAYANYELAKRMHNQNLEHQPLPDCVADLAYRRQQITGGHPGLTLHIDPISTGIGIKTHNAGPTHCTKMRIYRPKTCGVVPKLFNGEVHRPISSITNKKMGAMDLAICWDYRPENPADEPQIPKHIDGSNDSAGLAVFNCVKTPRDDSAKVNTGRSAGVFNNTLGESDFFDKSISAKQTDFAGENINTEDPCLCDTITPIDPRSKNVNRNTFEAKISKSNMSTLNSCDKDFKHLRDTFLRRPNPIETSLKHTTKCNRDNSNFFRRIRNRQCHKINPDPHFCNRSHSCEVPSVRKPAFKVGVPQYNTAGGLISSDSGCSTNSNRVLVVPRPRDPYSKKKYDIDTLIPPFRCLGGGAGEGGYPEHWRLASVYQHSFKPIQQRRSTLLHTVYK